MTTIFPLILVLLSCRDLNPAASHADDNTTAFDKKYPLPAAHQVNDDLKGLYAQLVSADRSTFAVEDVTRLRAALRRLERLDGYAREAFATGMRAKVNLDDMKRYRALAWLHGWASCSRMVAAVSRTDADEPTRRLRADLLAFDRPGEDRSALALLLAVYAQIWKGEGNAAEPLQSRLADHTGFFFDLAHVHDTHGYYIPSETDLVGDPAADPKPQRDLFSLWALINLQLDTWRDGTTERISTKLVDWLEAWSQTDLTSSFDQQPAPTKLGDGFRQRVEKIHRFVRFRAACTDEGKLKDVLQAIADARARKTLGEAGDVKVDGGAHMDDLVTAARPIGDESLPQAEIWLRYVLLLSYRYQGVEAIAHQATGVEAYWRFSKLPGQFLDPHWDTHRPEFAPGGAPRWNQRPAFGSFDRAVADATFATYRYAIWQATASGFDRERGRAATRPGPPDPDLVALVASRDAQIGSILDLLVKPYFTTADSDQSYGSASRSFSDWLRPEPIALVADPLSSKAERQRLRRDLREITAHVEGAARVQRITLDVSRAKNQEAIAIAIQGGTGRFDFAEWSPFALPSRTFDEYLKIVRQAGDSLGKDVNWFELRDNLQGLYARRSADSEIAALHLAAARLGSDIARRVEDIAVTYAKIADLSRQIAKLNHDADELLLQAADKEVKASDLKLVMATRARDLAAAQVEALEEAMGKAREMVDQAVRELEAMRPRLLQLADQIEESKKSSFLSILKAVVKVVGLALAPFTGGASIGITAIADQAIGVCEKIAHMSFNNLVDAIGQVAGVAGNLGNLGESAIGQVGGADAQKALGDIKSWIKDAKHDINRVGGDAGKLLDEFKKLPLDQVGRVATALAVDLPVRIDGQTVRVEFGKQGLKLNLDGPNGELGRLLKDMLDHGGMIAGDLKDRVQGLASKLPQLGDDALKEQLKASINDLVRLLPDDFLRKVEGGIDRVKSEFDGRRKELLAFIDRANADQRLLLSQILGGGLVVVRDAAGNLVAVARPVGEEVRRFQERINRFKEDAKVKALTALADKLQLKNKALQEAAGKAQEAKDETALRKIAREDVPKAVEAVHGDLADFQKQVAAARDALEDAKLGVDVATIQVESARLFEAAAQKRGEASALQINVADLQARAAQLEVERSLLANQQQAYLLDAYGKAVEAADRELRRVYALCLRWGVDPRLPVRPDQATDDNSLFSVLTAPSTDDRLAERAALDRMAEALFGAIQWIRLLPVARRDTFDAVGKTLEILKLLDSTSNANAARDELLKTANSLETVFQDLNFDRIKFDYLQAVLVRPKEIRWLDNKAADRESLLSDVPVELRPQILGFFRHRVTQDALAARSPGFPFVKPQVVEPKSSFYALLNEASVVREREQAMNPFPNGNLRFLIVPPVYAAINSQVAVVEQTGATRVSVNDLGKVSDQFVDVVGLGYIKQKLGFWKAVRLRGGVGDWTIYMLATDVTIEADRLDRIRQCRGGYKDEAGAVVDPLAVTLHIPYMEVTADAK